MNENSIDSGYDRIVHEITSTTRWSFCPSSALWQQLRSLLCACCHNAEDEQ